MKKFIALILIGVILSCTLSLPAFAFDNINQSDNLSVASVYGKSEEELSHFSSQLLEAMESNLYGAENVITEKSYFVLRKNNQTKEEEVISVTKEKYEQVISGTSISKRRFTKSLWVLEIFKEQRFSLEVTSTTYTLILSPGCKLSFGNCSFLNNSTSFLSI